MTKVFVSYSHEQGEWVWTRLVPVLKAFGAEVLIDKERFRGGIALPKQMDDLQDQADWQVLCFSNSYLHSTACDHEWRRALASDPGFVSGKIIPVKVEQGVILPPEIRQPNPLYFNLADDRAPGPWKLLCTSLGLPTNCCPIAWLEATGDTAQALTQMRSVNLVVENGLSPQPLIDHLVTCQIPRLLLPDLTVVDLASGGCASRSGFLQAILAEFGIRDSLPRAKPNDLVEFNQRIASLPPMRLALLHFDMVVPRNKEYGNDLFASFFELTQRRHMSLMVVSHRPYATLLPADHPISSIPFLTTELKVV